MTARSLGEADLDLERRLEGLRHARGDGMDLVNAEQDAPALLVVGPRDLELGVAGDIHPLVEEALQIGALGSLEVDAACGGGKRAQIAVIGAFGQAETGTELRPVFESVNDIDAVTRILAVTADVPPDTSRSAPASAA